MAAPIILYSNLRRITSGYNPTVESLPAGHAAIGAWRYRSPDSASDVGQPTDRVHLWANPGGTAVIDVVASTVDAILSAFTLQSVLNNGQEADLSILLNHLNDAGYLQITGAGGNTGNHTVTDSTSFNAFTGDGQGATRIEVAAGQIRMWETDDQATEVLKMVFSLRDGILDMSQPVLSAAPEADRPLNALQRATMRDKLEVFSKEDIIERLSGTFDFRGNVQNFSALEDMALTPENLQAGWVWQVINESGPNNERGLLWVWVITDPNSGSPAGTWEKLTFSWNMDFYIRSEIDEFLEQLETRLTNSITDLEGRVTVTEGDVDTLQSNLSDLTEKVEEHVDTQAFTDGLHSQNNFDAVSVRRVAQLNDPEDPNQGAAPGAEDTVLNGAGQYVNIELHVLAI